MCSESMSETELTTAEAMDLSVADASQSLLLVTQKPSPPTAMSKDAPRSADTDSTQREETAVQTDLAQNSTNITTTYEEEDDDDDDDAHSSKSLDLNFASQLIDFKFSEHEPQSQTYPPEGSSGKTAAVEEEDSAAPLEDTKHTCKTCGKSFRYAATLARHEKAHLCERIVERLCEENKNNCTNLKEEEEEMEAEEEKRRAAESSMDSGSEDEDEDKEDQSDEEGGLEPKNSESDAGGEEKTKADKRKKVCSVCYKRFWSLQDLTRHMRSHTGTHTYTSLQDLTRHMRSHTGTTHIHKLTGPNQTHAFSYRYTHIYKLTGPNQTHAFSYRYTHIHKLRQICLVPSNSGTFVQIRCRTQSRFVSSPVIFSQC